MTVEAKLVGETCNLSCPYCYEHPMRDAGNYENEYDLEKMKAALRAEIGTGTGLYGAFSLFGGEPLLAPIDDLAELCRWGNETFGSQMAKGYKVVSCQTNGSLVTDAHVELFKRYGVSVGISMDGPGELNDSRWAGTLEKTRKRTAQSQEAIGKLCAAGVVPSLIVTVYRGNATRDRREQFKTWVRLLARAGVRNINFHLLEVDDEIVREKWALTDEENLDFLLDMARFEPAVGMKFNLFSDIRSLLLGKDQKVVCTWNACDPYTTKAVRGVSGLGVRTNCGRTNKEGVAWVKADEQGYERYLALSSVPFDAGGCGGCRFWVMCKGQCPGTGAGGDWRNKTDACLTFLGLFEYFEAQLVSEGKAPLSLDTEKREAVELAMFNSWANGRTLQIYQALATTQPAEVVAAGNVEHGDAPHGDAPHGDSDHGDSDSHGDEPHGDSDHE